MGAVLVDVPDAGNVRKGDLGCVAHEPGERAALHQQLHVRMALLVGARQVGMRHGGDGQRVLQKVGEARLIDGHLLLRRARHAGQQRPQLPADRQARAGRRYEAATRRQAGLGVLTGILQGQAMATGFM